jgi:predicted transcriptional regulator
VTSEDLGSILRYKRRLAGLRLEQLASTARISKSALQKYETGQGLSTTIRYIKLLDILGFELVIRPRKFDSSK